MRLISKFKKCRELNPLWWGLLSWTTTIGAYGLGEIIIRLFGWSSGMMPGIFLLCVVIVAAVAPFLGLLLLVLAYKHHSQNLHTIVYMFLALVLLCANLNFLLMLHFGRDGAALPFHGIQPVWGDYIEGRPPPFSFKNAFLSVVDCLHFSVATLSTVGYGDIYPTTWYSKLIVDIEILMGLGINILTLGRYFSRGDR